MHTIDMISRGAFNQSPFAQQHQSVYGLGFADQNPYYSQNDHRPHDDDEDDDVDDDHTDKDDDAESQDESGPLSERIKQLHLEDVLAFLPSGGAAASGILSKSTVDDGYQRRTASGDRMPFQLDDELASLGTRTLEEILQHDGGDDDDDHRVRGIRFKETVGPSRLRGLGRDGELPSKVSPERSGPNSRKSSAQNSVGSSFSDLSDSSVTQSAMEDAYLSGYNNSKM
ncbi:hypothetical protein BGZ58_008917 [Dissophora ornata]|nr:hypothetical protein BGZ58_008917 [Dissophora ornata]